MNLIPPLEIASKIMTMIQEAEKELIIVTPYVSINGWDKMKKCLSKAVERGIMVTFIARKNAKQDLSPLLEMGIQPILVEDLHAKIYINDKYAIVSSMNLLQYSDNYSIDIGYLTQTKNERSELLDFIQKHIADIEPKHQLKLQRTNQRYSENKRQLNDYQVEKLFNSFINFYKSSDFVKTSSYIFSSDLIPFADVMIDTYYTIKISKDIRQCEQIFNAVGHMKFKFFHKFRLELYTGHDKFYYLYFIPTGNVFGFVNSLEDFKTLQTRFLRVILRRYLNLMFGCKKVDQNLS